MVQQAPKKKVTRQPKPKYQTKKVLSGLTPKTETQGRLIDALENYNQVMILGPAGTGKTYVVTTHASDLYKLGKVHKIVITRPHVGVNNKDIGYLPGDLKDKTFPWAMPVLDVLKEHLEKGEYESAISNGNIEVAPLTLIRGRTFNDAFIIVDEAQNLTVEEVKALLTRVGDGSTIVLAGDDMQSDLKGGCGLVKIIHLAKKYSLPIPVIEFGVDDIVRSDVCKMWVETFMKENL